RGQAQAQEQLAKLMAPANAEAPGTVRIRDGIWLGGRSVRSENGEPLPAALEKKAGVTLISPEPLTLAEFSAELSGITGLPVRIAISNQEEESTTSAPPGAAAQTVANGPAGATATPIPTAEARTTLGRTLDEAHSIEWTGPLSGLLDFVSAKFNVSWE